MCAGVSAGSALQSGSFFRIAATASETVSPTSKVCRAREHLEEHAAKRPDVRAPIDRPWPRAPCSGLM